MPKKILCRLLFFISAFSFVPALRCLSQHKTQHAQYREGDIIFQSSDSRQCQAVKLATHSDISHCGILLNEKGQWVVLEAVEPVQKIPLQKFISRGTGNHFTIKRLLSEKTLNEQQLELLRQAGEKFVGKHYDLLFNWSNTEIYCSELVWKLYREAGVMLCQPRKLKDFDLSNVLVKTMMKERYGEQIPFEEPVVAPSDIYQSSLLEIVEQQ